MFNHRGICIYILFFLYGSFWLIAGCTENKYEKNPDTANELLGQLLHEAPITTIDLDSVSIDTIEVSEENILGQKSISSFATPVYLSGGIGMVNISDNIYIADHRQDCIWMIDKDGNLARKIGRKGKGPREFEVLRGIDRNSNYVYTTDLGNARINVYDHQFNLHTSLDILFPGLQTEIAVTDSLLFVPADFVSKHLIEVRNATPPFNEISSFLPRIIPPGMEPRGYNMYHIQATNNGRLVFGYIGLPYIFLFDKRLKHVFTFILQSASYEEIDNPSLEPVAGKQDDMFSLTPYFGGFFLMDDGSLFIKKGFNLYRISFDGVKYHLKQIMHFTYADPLQTTDNIRSIDVSDVVIDHDTIYLSSIFEPYVFRVPLD